MMRECLIRHVNEMRNLPEGEILRSAIISVLAHPVIASKLMSNFNVQDDGHQHGHRLQHMTTKHNNVLSRSHTVISHHVINSKLSMFMNHKIYEIEYYIILQEIQVFATQYRKYSNV